MINSEEIEARRQAIVRFVGRQRTWLILDDIDDPETVSFSTRENGDVYNEEPGPADRREARRVGLLIKDEFPYAKPAIETIDEWTFLTVYLDWISSEPELAKG